MRIEEVTITAKLLDFISATVKLKPGPSDRQRQELTVLLDLLNNHRALYDRYEIEIVGGVANSIKILRGRLEALHFQDGFSSEARGLVLDACLKFQSNIEALSAQYMSGPQAIYREQTIITRLDPMYVSFFSSCLGELRSLVRIVLEAIRRRGTLIPTSLERLLKNED